MTERILLLSDIHMGSYWGPVADDTSFKDPRTGHKIVVEQSETNRFIYRHWEEMVRKNHNVSCIIVNGDAVDGVNRHNHGAVFTDDVFIQAELCAGLLGMLPHDVPIYITKGTGYHSGDEIKAERILAEMVGGVYCDEMVIEECGLRIFANHHIPHARNKAASLERKVQEFAEAHEYYDDADTLVFSHNHRFACVVTSEYFAVMTPGWQGKTPYAAEKNLITPSDIGWITLNVHDDHPGCISVDRSGITKQPQLCQIVGRDYFDRTAYRHS